MFSLDELLLIFVVLIGVIFILGMTIGIFFGKKVIKPFLNKNKLK
jgi:uncharacterized protein YneF (UPF0154 family)